MATFKIFYQEDKKGFRYSLLAKHLEMLLSQRGWSIAEHETYTFILGNVSVKDDSEGVFHVIFMSDVSQYYDKISSQDERYLIIRDISTNVIVPSRTCVRLINYPIPWNKLEKDESEEKYDIIVSTQGKFDDNTTLLKLIRPMNRMLDADILLDSNDDIAECVNSNITTKSIKKNIDDYVHKSTIIIGSGAVIIEAIIQKKKFIIAGETGYGGVPDNRNIHKFHENFFSGSIGGNLFDPIPEALIMDDLIHLIDNDQEFCFETFCDELSESSYTCLYDALKSLSPKGDSLMFNDDFTIVKKNGQMQLVNRYDRKFIMTLDDKTAMYIVDNSYDEIDNATMEVLKQKKVIIRNYNNEKR